jgi:hypothetical protein
LIKRRQNNNINKLLYLTHYNFLNPTEVPLLCACKDNENFKYNKNISSNPDVMDQISYNQRISQLININKGGITRFGAFYLEEPILVNSFGRVAGMPGGSGAPPKNKFR